MYSSYNTRVLNSVDYFGSYHKIKAKSQIRTETIHNLVVATGNIFIQQFIPLHFYNEKVVGKTLQIMMMLPATMMANEI